MFKLSTVSAGTYPRIITKSDSSNSRAIELFYHGNEDVYILQSFDGSNYVISFYTKKDNIDVSKLAVKYGGGGHRQASSFIIGNLPFNKL